MRDFFAWMLFAGAFAALQIVLWRRDFHWSSDIRAHTIFLCFSYALCVTYLVRSRGARLMKRGASVDPGEYFLLVLGAYVIIRTLALGIAALCEGETTPGFSGWSIAARQIYIVGAAMAALLTCFLSAVIAARSVERGAWRWCFLLLSIWCVTELIIDRSVGSDADFASWAKHRDLYFDYFYAYHYLGGPSILPRAGALLLAVCFCLGGVWSDYRGRRMRGTWHWIGIAALLTQASSYVWALLGKM